MGVRTIFALKMEKSAKLLPVSKKQQALTLVSFNTMK